MWEFADVLQLEARVCQLHCTSHALRPRTADADNRELVKVHFSWFLTTYDAMPHAVQRADISRIFYMIQYGGCYFVSSTAAKE